MFVIDPFPRWTMRLARAVVMLSLVLVLDAAAASAQRQQGTAISAAVTRRTLAWTGAFLRGDGAALAAFYTADAQVMPPNTAAVSGRASIEGFWQSNSGSGLRAAELETAQVTTAADLAVEEGRYRLVGNDGAVVDEGKYLSLWKRVGSEWMLHRQMWSSNLPPR